MKELETILKVLGEKIQHLETIIYCKDLEIKKLKEQLEKEQGNEQSNIDG